MTKTVILHPQTKDRELEPKLEPRVDLEGDLRRYTHSGHFGRFFGG